jgi:hypothetical protein
MKATQRNTILKDLINSIKTSNKIKSNLRKIALNQNVIKNIRFEKEVVKDLNSKFVKLSQKYVVNETKNTLLELEQLKSKSGLFKVDSTLNYQM